MLNVIFAILFNSQLSKSKFNKLSGSFLMYPETIMKILNKTLQNVHTLLDHVLL